MCIRDRNKSLKLIFVYTVATGSIFTFVNYWDSVFYGYCGSGTFLAFALMTIAILPVALVYLSLIHIYPHWLLWTVGLCRWNPPVFDSLMQYSHAVGQKLSLPADSL